MVFLLYVNTYKYVDDFIFPITSDIFHVIGICIIGNYAQKCITARLQDLLYGERLLKCLNP
jgi:hypothetical protein